MRDLTGRATLAVAALALAMLLGACGGGEEAPDVGEQPSADAVLNVSATEYAYALDSTTVPAGTIELVLSNDGTMAHDLVLEGDPGGATAVIEAGESDSFEVTLEPGTYTLYCSVGNHRAQGMEVEFTVS
ncbi:cupredoxin domain-containing protein [Demequina iriomotensis]|uniref:cupredoxin domain-containing protein n=1 Tax=Demequina iriomotensis TaxID=1536641 RepID=UPI0012E07E00|nr:cupredoxin domain-containing protein [Demequina iriomotensis]